ncbi:signal peptide peptidase SppA [Fusobacterium hominis]|uniref:Signal peptide peptidase SppA n=1 Tax=Fusobacterium hominis TaxID=2764326 RepID=A0A7G9GXV5_9FUSO|nr:signal peptide peptidase SppA [Fusobacterium hominis]QNM15637.1 signal peptide peptidase SppA [Fusobacterium hominis]
MKILKFLLKWIVSIVTFIIKEVFSFFIKGTLFLLIILILVGLVLKETKAVKKVSKPGTVVQLEINGEYPEGNDVLPSIFSTQNENFYSVITKLDAIAEDKNVKGLFVKINNSEFSNGQLEELGEKIAFVKSKGKEVITYTDTLTNKSYLLALNGNKIYMPPTQAADINLTGYYSELAYYKGLADRLGVQFNVIHVGDYKSFGENYTKGKMSKEYKENITSLKDTVYNNFIEKISTSRGILTDEVNNKILSGMFVNGDINKLLENKFIDKLITEDEIIKDIGKENIISFTEYDKKEEIKNSKNKIAIFYLNGEIYTDNSKNGDLTNSITPSGVQEKIDQIINNDEIKGVILRINSPGGSALASNIINSKIQNLKLKKPVYVSIGDVAASGGYYIASAGDKIFADKESITGSIGVVSLIPNFQKTLKKLDVNVETIQKGEYADLYSLTQDFTEKDREKIYDSSVRVYDEFVNVVAKGRGKTSEYINTIGQGKVWLGEEGKNIGLVDEIGGLEATIASFSKDLKLENYQIIEVSGKAKIDKILKRNIPFLNLYYKAENLININELYFKPLYYFPYDI